LEPTLCPNTPQHPNTRKQWLLIFACSFTLMIFNQLIEQLLNQQMTEAMQNDSASFVFTAAALFFNGVSIVWIQSVVLMTILQTTHPQTAQIPLFTKIGDFSREWLRSMGEASLWFFVFIIPGLIRWVDYTLLPFVCFYDPAYQNGDVDALERCRQLARGKRLQLWGLWVGFGLILPLVFTSLFGAYESLFEHPVGATALVMSDALIQMVAFWMLWRIYLNSAEKIRPFPV
jgi:hypothetical protein